MLYLDKYALEAKARCSFVLYLVAWCNSLSRPTIIVQVLIAYCLKKLNIIYFLAANSKVVDLVILPVSHVLVTAWPLQFTVWGCTEGDNGVWRNQIDSFFPRGLFWFSPQSFRARCCCSSCPSIDLCFPFCLFYWEAKFSDKVNRYLRILVNRILNFCQLGNYGSR